MEECKSSGTGEFPGESMSDAATLPVAGLQQIVKGIVAVRKEIFTTSARLLCYAGFREAAQTSVRGEVAQIRR